MKKFSYLFILFISSFLFANDVDIIKKDCQKITELVSRIPEVSQIEIFGSKQIDKKFIELNVVITLSKNLNDINSLLNRIAAMPLITHIQCNKTEEIDGKLKLNLTMKLFKISFENYLIDCLNKKRKYCALSLFGLYKLLSSKTMPSFIFRLFKQGFLTVNMLKNDKDISSIRALGYLLLLQSNIELTKYENGLGVTTQF